jgi:hypothetical protein
MKKETNHGWTRRSFLMGSAGLSLAAITPLGFAAVSERVLPEGWMGQGQDFKLAWRIKPVHWTTDEQFTRLLDFFTRHQKIVNEISLFVGRLNSWHGYMPPEKDRIQFALAGKRMEELRKEGFSPVGFNLWPTFGDEGDLSDSELPLPPMIGHGGKIAKHVICPSSPAMIEYLSRRFAMLAGYHPDFIWVDDDARMAHKGLDYPCFCDRCLAEFQEGAYNSREALVQALNQPGNVRLREQWIDYNAYRLDRVCAHVRDAVHSTDPSTDLGFMTVGPTHTSYSGDFIRRCMNTLESIRGRPGHTFYVDSEPRDILRKAMDVGWQIAEYPDRVTDIQYEYEDWPSIPLDKARTIISAECALAVASGCNGVAIHTFQLGPNPFGEYRPMMESLQADYSYLQQLTRATAHCPRPVGLWLPWNPYFMARRMVDGQWFRESAAPLRAPLSWCEFGIPLTAQRDASSGTILMGDAADAFTREELEEILSGAVFLDIQSLGILERHGLAHLAGVRPGKSYQLASERLTGNGINGNHSGEWRNVFINSNGWTLNITGEKVEVFSELFDVDGVQKGPCLTGYENELGGRVVVMGYQPWERIGTVAKLHQVREMVDWATDRDIPLRMNPIARIAAIARTNDDRTRITAVLLNNGFDAARDVPIILRARVKELHRLHPSGMTSPISFERQGEECICSIEHIEPWQTTAIIGS